MNDVLEQLRERIARVSPLWRSALRDAGTGATHAPHDSPREHALGVETIREGALLHYDESRLLAGDASLSKRLLVGDHCYAAGLCDVAATTDLDAVRTLSDLIADVAVLAGDGSGFEARARRWSDAVTDLNCSRATAESTLSSPSKEH